MLSVPGARTVAAIHSLALYVYIIFDDKTDLYWARSRVLEYLSKSPEDCPHLQSRHWAGWDRSRLDYEYALVDHSGRTTFPSCGTARLVLEV